MRHFLMLTVFTLFAACQSDQRATRERGALNVWDGPPIIKSPQIPRCRQKPSGAPRKNCEEAEFLAVTFVRRLAALDPLCVQGGIKAPPTSACQTRANVVDVGNNKLLVEILEARADSKWFQKEGSQFWFEEGALVDLILEEDGY
jgi:hypothetical protein